MKNKIILLSLVLAMPFMYSANFKIKLGEKFLKLNGKYLFVMNIEGKLKDKIWHVLVKDGKASIKTHKGLEGKGIKLDKKIMSLQ